MKIDTYLSQELGLRRSRVFLHAVERFNRGPQIQVVDSQVKKSILKRLFRPHYIAWREQQGLSFQGG
jgi:hypothetical protein